MPEQIHFIPTEAILNPQKGTAPITTPEDLQVHLERRIPYFMRALSVLSNHLGKPEYPNMGWETFVSTKAGIQMTKGRTGKVGDESLFTGESFCTIGSVAGIEALSNLCPTAQFVMAGIPVRRHQELDVPEQQNREHDVIIAIFPSGMKAIDLTYGQVDHRFVGKNLMIEISEIPQYYRSNLRIAKDLFGNISLLTKRLTGAETIKHGKEDVGMREEDFRNLIGSLL